jgi:F420-non-reducing hydrogenase large subunit
LYCFAVPDIARQVVKRHMCAKMLKPSPESIHPDKRPWGFSKPFQRRTCAFPMAQECLELAKFSIKFAKENIFPKYLDVKTIGRLPPVSWEQSPRMVRLICMMANCA